MRRQFAESLQVHCNVIIAVHDAATGRLLSTQRRHNLVTLAGRNVIRDLLGGIDSDITHVAVGTDNTAPASGDSALGAEEFRDVVTKRIYSSGKLQIQFYLPTTAANGHTLTEAGLLTASSGGSLFARVIYEGIAKTASVTVTYTWDVTIAAT